MKRIKLGLFVGGGIGIVLFGMTTPPVVESDAYAQTPILPLAAAISVGEHGILTSFQHPSSEPMDAASLLGSGHCPGDMVEIDGEFCPNLQQKCLRWLDPDTQMRCAEF